MIYYGMIVVGLAAFFLYLGLGVHPLYLLGLIVAAIGLHFYIVLLAFYEEMREAKTKTKVQTITMQHIRPAPKFPALNKY